jgi:type IV fimbrial biogenesis protein FimT
MENSGSHPPWSRSQRRTPGGGRAAGFTLIELMVTVVVLGVLLTVAVPNFTTTIRQNRLATQTNELITALNLARSEAIKRGAQVVVRKSSTNWESGWSVFYDADDSYSFNDDGDATPCEAGEDCYILQQAQALSGGTTVRTPSGGNYATYIAFSGLGAAAGGVSTGSKDIRVCGNDASTANARTITVDTTGRIRLTATASACP